MTTEERIDDLIANLPYLNKTSGGVKGFREKLRLALLEVARDQRHACAEAVADLDVCPAEEEIGRKAHQAVMNA